MRWLLLVLPFLLAGCSQSVRCDYCHKRLEGAVRKYICRDCLSKAQEEFPVYKIPRNYLHPRADDSILGEH